MINDDKLQQVLDRTVAERDVPGIVAEVREGDRTWFGTAGVADLDTGAARRPGEHFHTGSCGKSFTATALLRLAAQGRLDLDSSVNSHLPGVLDVNGYDGDAITVRHLLGNVSGLFPTGIAPEVSLPYLTRAGMNENRFNTFTLDELLRIAVSQPPIGAPGERFAYSNGGFYIAGAILEKLTGLSYADAVDRLVIEPLGLKHTRVRRAGETTLPAPHPRGYTGQFLKADADPSQITAANWESMIEPPGLPPLDTTEFDSAVGYAAGNVVSTTGDMIRFVNAVVSGELLPPELHRQQWTTTTTDGGHWMPHSGYGLGVFEYDTAETGGVVLRGVGGSIWGSFFFAIGTPDGDHTVAVHTNTEWKSWDLMFQIVEAEFGVTFED